MADKAKAAEVKPEGATVEEVLGAQPRQWLVYSAHPFLRVNVVKEITEEYLDTRNRRGTRMVQEPQDIQFRRHRCYVNETEYKAIRKATRYARDFIEAEDLYKLWRGTTPAIAQAFLENAGRYSAENPRMAKEPNKMPIGDQIRRELERLAKSGFDLKKDEAELANQSEKAGKSVAITVTKTT